MRISVVRISLSLVFITMAMSAHGQSYRIDSLRNELSRAKKDENRVDLLNRLSGELMRTTILLQAEDFANEALRAARDIDYKRGAADAFFSLGAINLVKGEYTLAMQYNFKALKLYDELEVVRRKAQVLSNMGLIMIEEGEYSRAYDFALQSKHIYRAEGDSVGVSRGNLIVAECSAKHGDFSVAKKYAFMALETFQKGNYKEGEIHAYYRLGNIFQMNRDFEMARDYYHRAATEALRAHHVILTINANKQLAKVLLELQQYDSSYILLHRTLDLAVRNHYRNNELDIYQLLAGYFKTKGQMDSVLYYTQVASGLEHELFDRQKRDQMVTLQMLSNFEEQDQELSFQKRIVRRQYIAISGVSLILILSVVFGFRIYALNKSNRDAKEALI